MKFNEYIIRNTENKFLFFPLRDRCDFGKSLNYETRFYWLVYVLLYVLRVP